MITNTTTGTSSNSRPDSTMPPRGRRSSTTNLSATDLLGMLQPDSKNGFLRLRNVSKILKTVKWRHRFVALTPSAVYLYENEMSLAPKSSFPLKGYFAVVRETSPTCAWVFALVPGVPGLERRSFACSSETDRKDWMYRLKENLYTSNNVSRRSSVSKFRDKLESLMQRGITNDEREYVELEFPVISLEDRTSQTSQDGGGVTEQSCDFEEEEEEDTEVETQTETEPRARTRSSGFLSTLESKSTLRHQARQSSLRGVVMAPPRYSAVVDGEECEYQNLPTRPKTIIWGLEKACTIVDENVFRDREKCLAMLKSTKRTGAYLIRGSRTSNYKVLTVLVHENALREYKLDESYGMHHVVVDPSKEFPDIDALLAYYSSVQEIPGSGSLLSWGIHECVDGNGMYEQYDDN